MSRTRSLDETAPLLHNAQRTQQPPDDCSIQSLPEVAGKNRNLGPRLLISLVVDSIPGMARARRFEEACTDQVTISNSHSVLYFTEFYPDSINHDHWPSGRRRTFCGCIFDDAGLRYWRVVPFLFWQG